MWAPPSCIPSDTLESLRAGGALCLSLCAGVVVDFNALYSVGSSVPDLMGFSCSDLVYDFSQGGPPGDSFAEGSFPRPEPFYCGLGWYAIEQVL